MTDKLRWTLWRYDHDPANWFVAGPDVESLREATNVETVEVAALQDVQQGGGQDA